MKIFCSLLLTTLLAGNSPISDTSWSCAGFGSGAFPPPPPPPIGGTATSSETLADQNSKFTEWRKTNWCTFLANLAPAPGKLVNSQPVCGRLVVIRVHSWFGSTCQICFVSKPNSPTRVSYWSFNPWCLITNRLREAYKVNNALDPVTIAKSLAHTEGGFQLDSKGEKALNRLLETKLPRKKTMPDPDDANYWVLCLSRNRHTETYEYYGSQDHDCGSVTDGLIHSISSNIKVPLLDA